MFTLQQEEKWHRLLTAYPTFLDTKTLLASTASLGKILGCRSNNVVRQLTSMNFHVQKMVRDGRNKFSPADYLDLRNLAKGGLQRGCYKEGGLKGNAIFLSVSLVS